MTRKVRHCGLDGYVVVSFFDNLQPGEVFIILAKQGSFVQAALDMLAMQASFLLQHDVPAAWLFGEGGKWRGQRVEPFDADGRSVYDTIADAVIGCVSDFGGQPDHGHLNGGPRP